jgi:predicted dehydrogenase
MTFHAAVIGCGKIGSGFADDPLLAGDVYTHAEAYVRSPSTELVAVCDRDADVAQRCGERWNVASFTTIERLLASAEAEIVSICTPDKTHYAIAKLAIEAQSVRAILCEKPLATNVEEGEELVRLARDSGKTIAVAYVRRYAENIAAVRRLLDKGSIGPLRAISGWYGKGVLHNGSHWFDLLRMLAGEVEWVEATDRLGEGDDDPSLDVTLGLASGAVATLRAADSNAYSIFEMDLLTEGGRIEIRDGGHSLSLYRLKPSTRYSGYSELAPEPNDFGDMRNLMLHAVDDLADALASGRPPLCTAEDGLAALRIAGAARRSAAHDGCRIEVSA